MIMHTRVVKVSAVILAKDEEATIESVVERCLPRADEVLVIDGRSRDRTRELAQAAGAKVFEDSGLGKGDGYRTGLEKASGEVAVFLDADGSHDPDDIPRLAGPILSGDLDMVIASRWRGGSDDVHPNFTHFVRDLGGNLLAIAISFRFKVELTDCLNGFRAMDREKALSLGLSAYDFDIEHEMVMKALKKGLRVGEVGSHEYARAGGKSKLPTFRKAHKFFIRLFREMV